MHNGRGKEKVKSILFKLLAAAVFIGVWQGAIELFHIKKYVLPEPLNVLKAIFDPQIAAKNNWWLHIGTTAGEIFLSFLTVVVLGVLISLAIAWSKPLHKLIMPLIVLLSSIPKNRAGSAVLALVRIWLAHQHCGSRDGGHFPGDHQHGHRTYRYRR